MARASEALAGGCPRAASVVESACWSPSTRGGCAGRPGGRDEREGTGVERRELLVELANGTRSRDRGTTCLHTRFPRSAPCCKRDGLGTGSVGRCRPNAGCKRSISVGPHLRRVSYPRGTGLHGGYARARVLFGVDLASETGQMLCLSAAKRAGKTTRDQHGDGRDTRDRRVGEYSTAWNHPRIAVTPTPPGSVGLGYCRRATDVPAVDRNGTTSRVTIEGSPRGFQGGATRRGLASVWCRGSIETGRVAVRRAQQQQMAIDRALITQPRLLSSTNRPRAIKPSIVAPRSATPFKLRTDDGACPS